MAIRIDVVVVVIDRGVEKDLFNPFVGMLVGSCFKPRFPRNLKLEAPAGPPKLFQAILGL